VLKVRLDIKGIKLDIKDREFIEFSNYIRSNFGINLTKKKKNLLVSRLNSILLNGSFSSFQDYFNYIVSDKTGYAVSQLVDRITTNHTYFYRESKHFEFLKETVIPEIVSKSKEKDIRIWSAGCATGEEPYTIAMVLDDYFKSQKLFWDTKVLATDLSLKALKSAKKGIYKYENISNLPITWQKKYFNKIEENKYEISNLLKAEVIYRRLNLMSNYNFKKQFQVIFCRNVMIYFDNETTHEIVRKFYQILQPGGYLFISHSESLDRRKTRLKYIKPAIYRKE
jgi:chemotaxis protein methyltransferase CheR